LSPLPLDQLRGQCGRPAAEILLGEYSMTYTCIGESAREVDERTQVGNSKQDQVGRFISEGDDVTNSNAGVTGLDCLLTKGEILTDDDINVLNLLHDLTPCEGKHPTSLE
jgi:hypothetical protein